MENKQHFFVPLPTEMELLGEGPSFQDALCAMLAKAKVFEGFGQPELMLLAPHMKAYRVAAGETIFREGNKNSYLSVLVEGRIAVYKEDSSDEVKLLGVISPGNIFGEISVIDNLSYSASLVAETDVVIVLMSRESFHRCINDNPTFGLRLLNFVAHLLCARLRSVSGQLVDYIGV